MESSIFFHRTKDEIISALLLFSESKSQLRLQAPRSKEPFGSSILSVQEDNQVILIDELIPFAGNEHLKSGDSLSIAIQHRGVNNLFDCEYLGSSVEASLPCHALCFPPEIKYFEKRNSFRVSLRLVDQHDVFIAAADGRRFGCRVTDLSAVGAGIALHDKQFDIEVGARIECEMNISGTDFCFPGRITHLSEAENLSGLHAGMEFIGEESSDLFRQLEKTMMDLQRKNIRSDPFSE